MGVWAVDEEHLPNYLLPRECARVCWAANGLGHALLGSPASTVIAVERSWGQQLLRASLNVHQLEPGGFTVLDAGAGHWVSEHEVLVRQVRRVESCFAALAEHDVELRLTTSLWPYVDAVIAAAGEFSAIRMRNAEGRRNA